MTFVASCSIIPKFPCDIDPISYDNFQRAFKHYIEMRDWCVEQGWKIGEDFIPNAVFSQHWFFKDETKLMWFRLRWS